jgi:two-component system nitrate/nitrite response regulator NarL
MTKATETIRVVLVEDDELARLGLRTQIEKDPQMTVAGEAATYRDAVRIAEKEQPDIILLDLNLGDESGMGLLPELSKVAPESRVIIVTGSRDDLKVHQQAITHGAMGLVLKHDALEHIARAIKQVSGGDVWFNRSMMMKVIEGMVRFNAVKQPAPKAMKIAALTEREREVVSLVGEGLKNKEIANRLRPFISETTVRHHLTSIYDKLGVSNRLELVIYAYIHGLATLPTSLPNLNNKLR